MIGQIAISIELPVGFCFISCWICRGYIGRCTYDSAIAIFIRNVNSVAIGACCGNYRTAVGIGCGVECAAITVDYIVTIYACRGGIHARNGTAISIISDVSVATIIRFLVLAMASVAGCPSLIGAAIAIIGRGRDDAGRNVVRFHDGPAIVIGGACQCTAVIRFVVLTIVFYIMPITVLCNCCPGLFIATFTIVGRGDCSRAAVIRGPIFLETAIAVVGGNTLICRRISIDTELLVDFLCMSI